MSLCKEFSKICKESKKQPWVYLIVVFVASFAAFLTWLALDSAGLPSGSIIMWSGGVFVAVALVLLGYFISCMRRYCDQWGSARS